MKTFTIATVIVYGAIIAFNAYQIDFKKSLLVDPNFPYVIGSAFALIGLIFLALIYWMRRLHQTVESKSLV